jgi:hypothetical protein
VDAAATVGIPKQDSGIETLVKLKGAKKNWESIGVGLGSDLPVLLTLVLRFRSRAGVGFTAMSLILSPQSCLINGYSTRVQIDIGCETYLPAQHGQYILPIFLIKEGSIR